MREVVRRAKVHGGEGKLHAGLGLGQPLEVAGDMPLCRVSLHLVRLQCLLLQRALVALVTRQFQPLSRVSLVAAWS